MSASAEAELAKKAQAGDRAAFGRLFEKYSPMVHGLVLARVPRQEVSDLMQDVFVAALGKLDSLRDPEAFAPWLASIARRRVVDFYRARKPDDELVEESMQAADAPKSEAERVLFAIRSLPEAYRETLMLRLVEGLSGPEIAVQCGLTPDSVRVNLHRGMALLREKLDAAEKSE